MKPELNIPNAVTALRVLLTPLFIWFLMSSDGVLVQVSAAVFLLAALSDWYDGWHARRYKAQSRFGTFFDPLADKVLVGAALIAFGSLGLLPMWMVLVVVGRDVLVTALRIFAERRGKAVVTGLLAKWKTGGQLLFLWYVVVVFTMNRVGWVQRAFHPSTFTNLLSPGTLYIPMIVLTALSVVTAVQYLIDNRYALPFIGPRLARSST